MYKAHVKPSPRDDKRYRVEMTKDGDSHSHNTPHRAAFFIKSALFDHTR